MSLTRRILKLRAGLSVPSITALREYQSDQRQNNQANDAGLGFRLADVLSRTWYLGFTAFGGPPVHFHILYQEFVQTRSGRTTWLDEQTYQELFAVCQALPGPGSTKMLFCIIFQHAGLIAAIISFLAWSLPGAVGMVLLAFGVEHINENLPGPVYALLSGFNASTVGIVALAAVQLASKAIVDPLTRILVIGSACAGLCYTALWYFPALISIGGVVAMIWDTWLSRRIGKIQARLLRRRRQLQSVAEESGHSDTPPRVLIAPHPRSGIVEGAEASRQTNALMPETSLAAGYNISILMGVAIAVVFFASFAAVLLARGLVVQPPLPLDLFANMYLAGTIIFGGGPVVIPLLREYVVQPGWVSSRDFLIGLAIIQAFPGPNFNFAVYLSALAIRSSAIPYSMVFGGLLGYIGIFVPGLALALAVQGVWKILRVQPAIVSLLRGINASAVGLVFTAVYRLWEIGYLMPGSSQGQSLATNPWFVVVATLAYSSSAWFKVPSAAAILGGAILGLLWYAAAGYKVMT